MGKRGRTGQWPRPKGIRDSKRTFDGKRYEEEMYDVSKSMARSKARSVRKKGYGARVVQHKPGKYAVFKSTRKL